MLGLVDKPSCFNVEIPTGSRHFFDTRVVRRGVQDVIIAEIDCNVSNSFHARFILSAFVGKIDTVASFQFAFFDELSLFDLCSCSNVKKLARAFIKGVLNERGTVEFIYRKAFEKVSFAVV